MNFDFLETSYVPDLVRLIDTKSQAPSDDFVGGFKDPIVTYIVLHAEGNEETTFSRSRIVKLHVSDLNPTKRDECHSEGTIYYRSIIDSP